MYQKAYINIKRRHRTIKMSNLSEKIQVIYTSNYRDEQPEHCVIGMFDTENDAASATLTWVIHNKKGGFDNYILKDLFHDINVFNSETEPPRPTDLCTPQDFIDYYVRNGMTWDKMLSIFADDGDSYFGDKDGVGGWDIIKNIIKV